MKYSLDDFDFDLPKELIAQRPAQPRDRARLLVYKRQDRSIVDDYFYNLNKYLPVDSTLVTNNSKVEKARLKFGSIEIFLLETVNDKTAVAMVRPGKKFKRGSIVELTEIIKAEVTDISIDGLRTLRFNRLLDDPGFDTHRLTPFPPYIKQDETLAEEYQTVYADPLGSKAAPTAGLHFTDDLLKQIKMKHPVAQVTLHVGLGTFAPVCEENLAEGSLHQELYAITKSNSSLINAADHITAVGTTTARVLESQGLPVAAGNHKTNIFIQPGYKFKAVDSLITNFHLPKSSLLMMVSAFMGYEDMKAVYDHAIKNHYRFYSFGDATLIL